MNIVVYGCGGTGINITRRLEALLQVESNLDDAKVHYVDTSSSNAEGIVPENIFKYENLDGCGSLRGENLDAIVAGLPKIFSKFPPGDMNIVVFSAAGGSGSVIGPLILENLLADGHTATAVVMGSHLGLKASNNTINTIQGLELAVQRIGRPIVIGYYENKAGQSFQDNDNPAFYLLGKLLLLANGQNKSIDSSDIANLFDFHRVTSNKPCLASISVVEDVTTVNQDFGKIISSAVLLAKADGVVPVFEADYITVGHLPENIGKNRDGNCFIVSTDRLNEAVDQLKKVRDNLIKQKENVAVSSSLCDPSVVAGGHGLVL